MPGRTSWMPAELPHGIPPLYPSFYAECLVEADQRVTAENMLALAMLVHAKLSLQAFKWFMEAGDSDSPEYWKQRYFQSAPEEELLQRPDLMLDSLHLYNPLLREALPEILDDLWDHAVRASRKYGPDLPINIWELEK